MKNKFILLTGIVVVILTAGYFYKKYRVAPDVDFRSLELRMDDEKSFIADIESKKILVCFFATWCRPCMEELPSLKKAQHILNDDDLFVVLISDERMETLNAFWERTGRQHPFRQSVKKLKELKIETLPTAYLLNEKREVVFKKVGAVDWGSEEMIRKIREAQ